MVRQVVTREPLSVDEALQRFQGGRRDLVQRHLETLALLGEVQQAPDGRYSGAPVPV